MEILLVKGFAIWLILMVVAILNGIAREKLLHPTFGQVPSQILSGILLSSLILLLAWVALPWFGNLSPAQYWLMGGDWLLLTLIFEFTFGHYVAGQSWHELFETYRPRSLMHGNLWLVILTLTLLSPFLAATLRGFI